MDRREFFVAAAGTALATVAPVPHEPPRMFFGKLYRAVSVKTWECGCKDVTYEKGFGALTVCPNHPFGFGSLFKAIGTIGDMRPITGRPPCGKCTKTVL